jgi:hypothetical protein
MGVDFHGYSKVIVKPIPKQYQAKITRIKVNKDDIFSKNLTMLSLLFNGEYNFGGEIYKDNLEISEKGENWLEKMYQKNKKFIRVNWRENIYYEKSSDTEDNHCYCSYSYFGDFNDNLIKIKGKPLKFRIPDTDVGPYYGFIQPINLRLVLEDLNETPDVGERFQDFYHNFKLCVELGSQQGIFTIS